MLFSRYSESGQDSRWRIGSTNRWLYHSANRSAARETTSNQASIEPGARHDGSNSMEPNSNSCRSPIGRTQSIPSQCQLCQTHLTLQHPASTASSNSRKSPILSLRGPTVLRVFRSIFFFQSIQLQ